VSVHGWRVLTWRDGHAEVYEANTYDLTCTCGHNAEDNAAVCDHLAVVLAEHPKVMECGEALALDLQHRVDELKAQEPQADQQPSQAELSAADAMQGGNGGGDTEEFDVTAEDVKPAVLTMLENHGLDTDDFAVYTGDEYGGVQIHPVEDLGDDFGAWRDMKDASPHIWYDKAAEQNYIPPSRFEEFVG